VRIGIAGPMSLELLQNNLHAGPILPKGYPAPIVSILINELINKGHSVVAFTTSENINASKTYSGNNLILHIIKRKPHAGRNMFWSERLGLLQAIKKENPEIINAHWSYEFAWAAIQSGIPCIVTVRDHASTVLKFQPDLYRAMRLIMNMVVLKKSRYLSTNSNYLYNILSNKDKNKARIIPNFYHKKLEQLRKNKTPNSKNIVSVSNGFGKRKNIISGLIAFQILRQNSKDYQYILIGSEMEVGGPAHAYAKDNHLTDGVRFLGRLTYKQVQKYISQAILLLHPAREETFGMVVLEAMVLGTVVVGGENSGNIPNLLGEGKYGVLCDINDPMKIFLSMDDLLQNPAKRKKFSNSAFEYVKKEFSSDIVCNKYIEYYQYVLESEL